MKSVRHEIKLDLDDKTWNELKRLISIKVLCKIMEVWRPVEDQIRDQIGIQIWDQIKEL